MSAQVTITQLPAAGPITGTESVPIVQNGQTVQTTTGAIAASPSQTQTFLTVNSEPTLPNSRYLSTGTGLGLTDGGPLSSYTLTLNRTAGSLESASTAFVVKNTASTVVTRSLQASGNGLSLSNGDGISGNPTYSLTGQVASLANTSAAGIVCLPNNGSVVAREINGTASEIDVSNGTGAIANPTIGLADNPILPGVRSVTFPIGGISDRPPTPINGMFRYNSDTATFEGYANNAWGAVVTGSGVTSVNASGGTTGLSFTGGPITSSGTLTMSGTLIAANGGTGHSSYTVGDLLYASGSAALSKLALGTSGQVLTAGASAPQYVAQSSLTVGSAANLTGGDLNRIAYNTAIGNTSFIVAPTVANTFLEWSGTAFRWAVNPLGTVTSVDVSGGTTGLTTSGGPITTSGTITLAGTLAIANGGTGQTTAQAAINSLAGATTSGNYLRGDGSNVVMSAIQVADVPTLNQNTTGNAATATSLAGGAASQIPYQTGAGATSFIANGTAGQVLTSAGAGVPVWSGISGGTF